MDGQPLLQGASRNPSCGNSHQLDREGIPASFGAANSDRQKSDMAYKPNWIEQAKHWIRGTIYDPGQHFRPRTPRICPCCDYSGQFVSSGKYKTDSFRCPNCASRPRDRQIALMIEELGLSLHDKRILHFAPEWPLFRKLRAQPGYVGGDIRRRPHANAIVDITSIQFPDRSFDLIICNHVLEHVPDEAKALSECLRVLKTDGQAIFSVPLQRGRTETWEPAEGTPKAEIERICGWDHVRLYGEDFPLRLAKHGFVATPMSYPPEIRLKHSLFDEDIFIAHPRQDGLTASGTSRPAHA